MRAVAWETMKVDFKLLLLVCSRNYRRECVVVNSSLPFKGDVRRKRQMIVKNTK